MIDLTLATQRTAAVIAAIDDDQLGLPTPCPRYTVGDLLDHVDGLAQAFTDAATKTSPERRTSAPPPGDAERLGPGWRTRIVERLGALGDAWRDPAAWEGMTRAGGIDMPAGIGGVVALDEVLAHGWDLARATGQLYEADPQHVDVCIRTMGPQPGEERPVGDDVAFGRPVDVPADAPPIDRLVAMLGRTPAWSPHDAAR